ncbi:unnamed protein product [Ranitomeya imitator]|uniref:Chromo domain-containing protein n=1 Tax=Ranitomeya imitator TaxID=111125 RepID=A0ABN9LUI0_9NEOB|nr:unnamed protein product [Ranitomeya imitator]
MPVSSTDSRVADWAVEARDIWDRTQDAIRASKERMRVSADTHRRPAPVFAPGDLVWLSARNIRLRDESTKFAPRYIGPFKVLEQVNPVVYRLAIPPRLGITDTFHVSLLKPVHLSRFSESSAGTSGSSTDEFEVNAIVGCKVVRGKKFYLVDWKGHGPEDRTWEPVEHIRAPLLIAAFERNCGANCHKQCKDLLVLACRKLSRAASISSSHGSLPNSPSIATAQDEVFEFPPFARDNQDLDGRAITLVTGSSRKISVRLQRATTSQATQTDPVWPDSGWSDTGSHTFPKMKCKFYSKSTKNKGFAKWENEKTNMHPNMDIMEVQIMEQLQDHNGIETKEELSSTEV